MDSVTQIIKQIVGFFAFMSSTYGTGNLSADTITVGGIVCVSLFILGLLKLTVLKRSSSQIEIERLEFIAELLSELGLQLNESRTQMLHEFHRCKGELGAMRQELEDIKAKVGRKSSSHGSSGSLPPRRATSLYSAFGQNRA